MRVLPETPRWQELAAPGAMAARRRASALMNQSQHCCEAAGRGIEHVVAARLPRPDSQPPWACLIPAVAHDQKAFRQARWYQRCRYLKAGSQPSAPLPVSREVLEGLSLGRGASGVAPAHQQQTRSRQCHRRLHATQIAKRCPRAPPTMTSSGHLTQLYYLTPTGV